MNIVPRNDNVLVSMETNREEKVGRIHVPETRDVASEWVRAIVLAVGPGRTTDNGKVIEVRVPSGTKGGRQLFKPLKPGMLVFIPNFAGYRRPASIHLKDASDKSYLVLIEEKHVLAVAEMEEGDQIEEAGEPPEESRLVTQ